MIQRNDNLPNQTLRIRATTRDSTQRFRRRLPARSSLDESRRTTMASSLELLENPPGRRVVVITGGSSGIGRAAARHFAQLGDDVAIIARGLDALVNAAQEVHDAGRRAIAFPMDVTDPLKLSDVVEEIEARLGPIDVWINAAALAAYAPFTELTPDEIRRINDTTYLGTAYGTHAALNAMQHRNRGVIVQLVPDQETGRAAFRAPYHAAKQAIVALSDAVREELKCDGSRIRLVTVELPAINTPLYDHTHVRMSARPTPDGTVFQPVVAAKAIAKAALGNTTRVRVRPKLSVAQLLEPIRSLAAALRKPIATVEPRTTRWCSNLWHSYPGDAGAHGRFDAIATPDGKPVSRRASHMFVSAFVVVASLALLVGLFLIR